jgi:hypothetical protein
VDSTRRPASSKCTKAQYFPLHLPTGVSSFTCLRAGIPAPTLSGDLLLHCCQEAGIPRDTEAQHSPLCLSGRAHASPIKSKNARLTTEGRKAVTYYSASSTRRPASQDAQMPGASHCASLQESKIFPVQELESQALYQGQSATLQVLGGLPPTVDRD